jgi:dipeptidyl aminopeptidase/acylaminoacyl peptidase
VSDVTGWWNLYRHKDGTVEPLHPMKAEFGQPQWVFRERNYAFESPNRIICSYILNGTSHLARLNTDTGGLEEIPVPYTNIYDVLVGSGHALLLAGSPALPLSLVKLDLKTLQIEVLRRAREESIDPRYISVPETIEFPTEQGKTAYAFYYPAKNADYLAPAAEKPPLLVMSHGGPTASTGTTLRYGVQFWTSHGIAVVDVDYGGSTGYGREYRKRLEGNWGIVDVDDCVNAARYLVKRGDVDPKRLAITGGSAGGYTTLCALTFRKLFNAGASYFGVSDLEALTKDTHKFESRYEHRLVGPYPERADLYRERSAINYADHVSCPMILFQGLEDKVVPPDQAAKFYDAVRKKGLPAAYIAFEGEQHGFRKAENLKRSIEAELYFYSKIFGFEPGDAIEPVHIENMKS